MSRIEGDSSPDVPANRPASRASDGVSAETALQLAIDLHGPGLLNHPDKLRLHLEAQCPDAGSDLSFLMAALEEKVPQSLLTMKSVEQMQTVVPQLQEMLTERRGLNPFAATWAVSTWAAALRMDLFGDTPARAAARSASAASTAQVEGIVAPPAFTVPFGIPARESPSNAAVPQHVEPAIVAAAVEPRDVPGPIAAPPQSPAMPDGVAAPMPSHVPPKKPPIAAQSPTADIASEAPRPADPRVPSDSVVPPWATAKKKASSGPQSFNPLWGVAGLVAAIAVALVTMRMMSSIGEQPAPVATSSPPVVEPVAPSASPVSASPVSTPPASTPPASAAIKSASTPATIAAVVSDDTLRGDGQPHAVYVAIDPTRRDVRSIEATFMSGDGTWEPRSRVTDVQPDAIHDGRIAVGPIGLRTTKPATATFQYVVTTTDGVRSPPFVKQFVFAPVAARPPVIADIVVPPGIVAGTPFTLTIDFTPGESGIASVERKTIGTDAPPRTTSLAGLASPKDGTLRYPVEAIESASRITFAITLVDRAGTRSEPHQVVIDAPAPKRVAEKPVEALPAKEAPIACSRTTCGSVAAVREIDRTKTYEVIARMDDRTIRTMVSTAPWKVGTRVRLAGSRFVAINAAATTSRRKAAVPAPVATPESPPIVDR